MNPDFDFTRVSDPDPVTLDGRIRSNLIRIHNSGFKAGKAVAHRLTLISAIKLLYEQERVEQVREAAKSSFLSGPATKRGSVRSLPLRKNSFF